MPTCSRSTACWRMRDMMEVAALDVPALHDPPHRPIDHPAAPGAAQHLPHHSRRRLAAAAASVRVVLDLSRAPSARGKRRPEGAGHQDDPVPHLERLQHSQLSERGGAQRQAGCRRRRAEGPFRRGRQHPVRESPGRVRHPRHLRRGRSQDALQGNPGCAPGLQRAAPLRAHRHRQLSRRHGAHLQRLRPADLRRRDRTGPDRAVQLPDHRLSAEALLPQAAALAEGAEEGVAGEDRARDRGHIRRRHRA